MVITCYPSHGSPNQIFIKKALAAFKKKPISKFEYNKIHQSKMIFDQINKDPSEIYFFVFGGACFSSILSQFFYKQTKKINCIVNIDSKFLKDFLKKTKKELQNSQFVFISKSGKTLEILFYLNFIKTHYSQQKISLKNKIKVLTQETESPLLESAKKEFSEIVFFKEALPGRFSFFSVSGFLQFQAYGLSPSKFSLNKSVDFRKAIEFLVSHKNKKEIWLCSLDTHSKSFSDWMELAWSESLFKQGIKQQAPLLRHINFDKLQHGFIEELVAKKDQVCLWILNFKTELNKDSLQQVKLNDKKTNNKKNDEAQDFESSEHNIVNQQKAHFETLSIKNIQQFIKSHKIPTLFVTIDFTEKELFNLIFLSYQMLFTLGELFEVNIFKNEQTNSFKNYQL